LKNLVVPFLLCYQNKKEELKKVPDGDSKSAMINKGPKEDKSKSVISGKENTGLFNISYPFRCWKSVMWIFCYMFTTIPFKIKCRTIINKKY
jgi:hypothetical protein